MTTIRPKQPGPGRSGSGAPEPAGGEPSGIHAPGARHQIEEEHHVLWSLVERLERTSDLQALALRLGELQALLAEHFAREEAPEGLRDVVDEPRWESALQALFDEHALCLAEVDRLALTSRELLAGPVEELRRDVRAVCQRLHDHETAETELLAASLYDETGGGD
ncbi:MAG: hypothetical protein ACLF0P_08635 [Thermoanaerobaculia bacterium]